MCLGRVHDPLGHRVLPTITIQIVERNGLRTRRGVIMALIEQFVFTDRIRGRGEDPKLDGGFQIAASSKGISSAQKDKLVTMAGDMGQLFLNTVAMSSDPSVVALGTKSSPIWCWSPLDETVWTLNRSVYLGQSVSSSRPGGNYLYHALVLRPDELASYRHNPVILAGECVKRGLFWSEDRGSTALEAAELTTGAKLSEIDLLKVREALPPSLAQSGPLKQVLSLIVRLDGQIGKPLLLTGVNATEVWSLIGKLLLMLPSFMRARICLSNVCLALFVRSATTPQALAALPDGATSGSNNDLPELIGRVDVPSGGIELAVEDYEPSKLMSWLVEHLDGTATRLYRHAEAAGLSSLADYEILPRFFDLIQAPSDTTRSASPPSSSSESQGMSSSTPTSFSTTDAAYEAVLDDMVSLNTRVSAPQGWLREALSDLLETRYGLEDRAGVRAALRSAARRSIGATSPQRTVAADQEDMGDFFSRLENRILNSMRRGHWSMIDALLEGMPSAKRGDALLRTVRLAGASMRLPEADDAEQKRSLTNAIQAVISSMGSQQYSDQFLAITELLFVLMADSHVEDAYKSVIVACMSHCAKVLRGVLQAPDQVALDTNRLRQLLDSPNLAIVPEMPLLCMRIRMRQLIQDRQSAMVTVAGTPDGETVAQLAKEVAVATSRGLQGYPSAESEIEGVLDQEYSMLPASPPCRALALGLLWPDAPESCRTAVFKRFCSQSVLGHAPQASPFGNAADQQFSSDWRRWLIEKLLSAGKPEAAMKWAFESATQGPRAEFQAVFERGSEKSRLTVIKTIGNVIPTDARKWPPYRQFVYAMANDPVLYASCPEAQSALLRTVIQLIHPGEEPPAIVTSVPVAQESLSVSDRQYLRLVQLVWTAQSRANQGAGGARPWLEAWTTIQQHRLLSDQAILSEWSAGPRRQILVDWVLQWLETQGPATSGDMEIALCLLRKFGAFDEPVRTEALRRAVRGIGNSWVDLAYLLVWASRRYAGQVQPGASLPGPLHAMLQEAASKPLRQVSGVFRTPIQGIPQHMHRVLANAITRRVAENRPTNVASGNEPQRKTHWLRLPRLRRRSRQSDEPTPAEQTSGPADLPAQPSANPNAPGKPDSTS